MTRRGILAVALLCLVFAPAAGGRGTGAVVQPLIPVNTIAPAVSGTVEETQVLTATTGTWSNSPESYAYEWQDCNSGATSCAAAGGTSNTYTLVAGDVGKYMRVVVKATNTHGTGIADSTITAIVKSASAGGPNLTATHCFENPETEGSTRIEGCGYPGPGDAGISKATCEADPEFKEGEQGTGEFRKGIEFKEAVTVTGKRFKVKLGTGEYVEGSVGIGNPNVHFVKDCFVVENTSNTQQSPVIYTTYSGATGFHMSESAVYTKNGVAKEFFFAGFENHGGATGVIFEKDRIEGCEECFNGGGGSSLETITGTYLIANGDTEGTGVHREAIYQNAGKLLLKDDTILNPANNTALIFGNTNSGNEPYGECKQQTTIEESMLAGSADGVELCGKEPETRPGTSLFVFKHNRIARCLTGSVKERNANDEAGSSYFFCSSTNPLGVDEFGYFPKGGTQSIISTLLTEGQVTWEGNFYDDSPGTPLTFTVAKE